MNNSPEAMGAEPGGVLFKEPCGGCGEKYASKRCFGCHHETNDWAARHASHPTDGMEMVEELRQWAGNPYKLASGEPVLQKAAAIIQRLTEENEALRKERTSLIETKREQIKRLTAERDEALDAENQAKDCFWAVYPTYCEVKGHGISTEAARTALSSRIKALEEALGPFAAYADGVKGRDPHEVELGWYAGKKHAEITPAHFHAAARTLSSTESKSK